MSIRQSLDLWATSYRNTRACASVILLGVAIVVGLSIHYCDGSDPVVRTGVETGTLVEIVNRSSRYGIFMGVIDLPDGTQIRLPLSPPLPADGDPVRVHIDYLESGERQYSAESTEPDPTRF